MWSILKLKETIGENSGELKPLQLDSVGAHVRNVVMCLLREPAFGATPEDLGKSHGHLRRNSAPAIYQFRQSSMRNAERGSYDPPVARSTMCDESQPGPR